MEEGAGAGEGVEEGVGAGLDERVGEGKGEGVLGNFSSFFLFTFLGEGESP